MANVIVIKGRMVRDPDTHTTQSGVEVCNFTVAVDRNFRNKDGTNDTDYFPCTIWRGGASVISKFFTKGSEIVVSGSMESENYTDKDGNKRTSWKIQVQNFDFCGSKKDGSAKSPEPFEQIGEAVMESEEELPF